MSRGSVCNKVLMRAKRISEIATAPLFIGYIMIAARSAR